MQVQKTLYTKVWKFKCHVIKFQIFWKGPKIFRKTPSLFRRYFWIVLIEIVIRHFKKKGDFFKFFGLLFLSAELYITNYFISLLVLTSIGCKNWKISIQIPHSFHAELLEKDHALLENSLFLQPLAGIYGLSKCGWIISEGNYYSL